MNRAAVARVVSPSGSGRVDSARPFSGRRRPLGRAILLAFCTGLSSGCYTYVPVASAPPSGSVVSLHLNDTGRVALGKTVGAAAEKIEGALESSTDSAYVLRMQSVTFFNGQRSGWTGERVVVGKQFIFNSSLREFSSSKTTLAVLAGLGAVAAFIVTRSVLGSGNTDNDPGGGGPPVDQFRRP